MNRLAVSGMLILAMAGPTLPAFASVGQGRDPGEYHEASFSEVNRRGLHTAGFRATVRLLDGRAHFARLHAGHLGHAGIPTHRLTVGIQARPRVRHVPAAADVEVTMPSGRLVQTPLWREEGLAVADLDLAATGSYGFRLAIKEGEGRHTFRWTETLR